MQNLIELLKEYLIVFKLVAGIVSMLAVTLFGLVLIRLSLGRF